MLNIYSQFASDLPLDVELPSLYTSSTQTTSSTEDSSTALSPNVQVRLRLS